MTLRIAQSLDRRKESCDGVEEKTDSRRMSLSQLPGDLFSTAVSVAARGLLWILRILFRLMGGTYRECLGRPGETKTK
jgi:hypothetical protein